MFLFAIAVTITCNALIDSPLYPINEFKFSPSIFTYISNSFISTSILAVSGKNSFKNFSTFFLDSSISSILELCFLSFDKCPEFLVGHPADLFQ